MCLIPLFKWEFIKRNCGCYAWVLAEVKLSSYCLTLKLFFQKVKEQTTSKKWSIADQSLSDQKVCMKGDNNFNMCHSASLTYIISFVSAPVFSQSKKVKFKPLCNSYTLTIAFLKGDLNFPAWSLSIIHSNGIMVWPWVSPDKKAHRCILDVIFFNSFFF